MDSSAKFAALVEKVEKTKRICLAHNDVAQNYMDQISDLLAMSIHQPRPLRCSDGASLCRAIKQADAGLPRRMA
jgi:hypothetical protein